MLPLVPGLVNDRRRNFVVELLITNHVEFDRL